ncbi:MAG: hypothetical protein ABI051_08805 [Vicinamibacterales bacterium]
MSDSQPPHRVLPDEPLYRPLERFWPYAELPEQPTEEELAQANPELRAVLFGAPTLPFSMSIEFPAFTGDSYARAVELARRSDEYVEFTASGSLRHRARFFPAERAADLRDLYELVAGVPDSAVLVDDRPVPYARELWLPLVWLLIR